MLLWPCRELCCSCQGAQGVQPLLPRNKQERGEAPAGPGELNWRIPPWEGLGWKCPWLWHWGHGALLALAVPGLHGPGGVCQPGPFWASAEVFNSQQRFHSPGAGVFQAGISRILCECPTIHVQPLWSSGRVSCALVVTPGCARELQVSHPCPSLPIPALEMNFPDNRGAERCCCCCRGFVNSLPSTALCLIGFDGLFFH